MGLASGCYISTIPSIMMDHFRQDERQRVTGFQAVFVNVGGILAGLFGGLLATWQWYGGFLIALSGIPMGIFAVFSLPKEHQVHPEKAYQIQHKTKTRIGSIAYKCATALVVCVLLFSVNGRNPAIHLARSGFQNPALVGMSLSMIGPQCVLS